MNTNSSTFVEFIQWSGPPSFLSGTLQVDEVQDTPPDESLGTNSESIRAEITGGQIGLTINGGNELFGQVEGKGFTVNIPQQNGTFSSGTFLPATLAEFNQVVARIQGFIGNTNGVAEQQQQAADAQAAHAAQIEKEQEAISSDGQSVQGDIQGLTGDESGLASDVESISTDLTTEDNDLSATGRDEPTVTQDLSDGNQDEACSDADVVASDADAVSSDTNGIESDANGIMNDIQTLDSDLSTLRQDWQGLESAEAALPSYSDGVPTQADVVSAEQGASGAVASAVSQTNADIAQAGQYEDQAYADADAASVAGSCGSGPPIPSPPATLPQGG